MTSATLAEVSDFVLDGTHSSPARVASGIPVLSAQNVNGGTLSFETDRFTTQAEYQAFSRRLSLRPDDLLLTIVGTIGRAALLTEVRPLVFQRSVAVVRPSRASVHPRFLLHATQTKAFQEQLRKATNVSSQAGVYLGRLKEVVIPLPSLAEQLRIANVLDCADALRVKRRAVGARVNTLISNIFLEMFGNPFRNPERWPETTLGAHAKFTGGGTPSRAHPEFFSGSVCWATSKDMRGDFLDDTEEHITGEAIGRSATKLVPAGTILVVVKSKVLMHRLPVAIARVPTCFGQDLKGISPDREFWTVPFVATALRLGQRWLLERARGANTEGLTLEHLRGFPMTLPPLAVQEAFDARARAVATLGAATDRSLAQLDALFASLQHRAFGGEL